MLGDYLENETYLEGATINPLNLSLNKLIYKRVFDEVWDALASV
jgi:hypothetical protein